MSQIDVPFQNFSPCRAVFWLTADLSYFTGNLSYLAGKTSQFHGDFVPVDGESVPFRRRTWLKIAKSPERKTL